MSYQSEAQLEENLIKGFNKENHKLKITYEN